jgi:hemolysin III
MHNNKQFTIINEIANAVTHGIGTVFAVAALVILVVFAGSYGDLWHIISVAIYGSTLVILYLTSTLYHSFQGRRVKHIFRILDHSAIYLLIAGTYTPFTLVTLRGALSWTVFAIIWTMALSGVVLKVLFIKKFAILFIIFYLLMGWLVLFTIKPLLLNLPGGGLIWLITGGVFYSLGVIFYIIGKKRLLYHAIWHLFVLGGSICHFFSILFYVLPLKQ